MVLLGADLAISESDQADYTAIATCGLDWDLNLYLLDVVWGHWSMNRILKQLTRAAAKAKALYGRLDQIAIEKVQFQAAVVQEMLRTTKLPARGVVPDRDKVSRARAWAIRAEQGKVYADREARWWPAVLDQLVDFPTGTNDDVVDGVSAAWEGLSAHPAPGFVELDW
jgi:predicted phage terminase large subunit-like protein